MAANLSSYLETGLLLLKPESVGGLTVADKIGAEILPSSDDSESGPTTTTLAFDFNVDQVSVLRPIALNGRELSAKLFVL